MASQLDITNELGKIKDIGNENKLTTEEYLKSIQGQADVLGQEPSRIQQAFEVGKSSLQSQAAQSLAGSKAVSGGRGLAAARGTAISAGTAQANLGAQAELSKSSALQEAAKAKTALAAEKKKIGTEQATKIAQVQTAVGLANQIIKDESGVFFTSSSDIEAMKNRFKTEIMEKYSDNPEALQAAVQAFNAKLGNNEFSSLIF